MRCVGETFDLDDAVVRVRSSYTGGALGTPKNRERRDVDLISDVVELLGRWRDEHVASFDELVFPERKWCFVPFGGGSAPASSLSSDGSGRDPARRADAREADLHSFRHTFAKRALESGAQITWLSRHLGHSSLKVTTDVYGHWERAEHASSKPRRWKAHFPSDKAPY